MDTKRRIIYSFIMSLSGLPFVMSIGKYGWYWVPIAIGANVACLFYFSKFFDGIKPSITPKDQDTVS